MCELLGCDGRDFVDICVHNSRRVRTELDLIVGNDRSKWRVDYAAPRLEVCVESYAFRERVLFSVET